MPRLPGISRSCPSVICSVTWTRNFASALLLLAAICLARPATLTASANDPAAVEAAILFNILKFIESSAPTSERNDPDLLIVAAGGGDLNAHLQILNGSMAGRRTIKVIQIPADAPLPNEVEVLCIGTVSFSEQDSLLELARQWRLLTVSDNDNFASRGGIIGFSNDNGRIRFDINLDAARQAQIKISSKLASLARKVIENGKERKFR